ncbi:MAG: RES family NAD+ phosphorylase [Chloroflexota bacterium]|nr:RES family NAD+ phosphorylase [Chloroflexota bacterium]MDQ3690064.1 RES family NAD+ phosphorylase [Chloroflexota bacterium]
MALRDLLGPWTGVAYRHIPAGVSRSALDETYLGRSPGNRWNEAGTPTLCFASDIAVVLAEYGRHIATEIPDGVPERLARSLWEVAIWLERTLDLRDPRTIDAMGSGPVEDWILDVKSTQATANYLRTQAGVQALIVPSVAFLDRPDTYNLIVYRDRIDPEVAFGQPKHVRDFVLDARGGSAQQD